MLDKGFSSALFHGATQALDKVMYHRVSHSLSLQDASPIRAPLPVPDKPIETLYIHIPFCHTLCRFCSFHKVKFNESLARSYFIALRQEITAVLNQGYRFNRVYIGGGTTTILEDELIETITLIKNSTQVREVSCESDPIYFHEGHPERLQGLVDRMSIGVQSFDDAILKATGRFEKFGSGIEQANYIAAAIERFPTVNIDMMYGFALQDVASVQQDLAQAKALKPDQITTYPLTPGLGKNRKKCAPLVGKPSDLYPQFQAAKQCLSSDYHMEFPWTFSRNSGEAVQHKYVLDGEDCFGVGSGAFGRFGDRFLISSFDIPAYITRINSQPHRAGVTYDKFIDPKALMQHHLMIMMGHGKLDAQVFKAHTGKSLWQAFPLELSFLGSVGALTNQGSDYLVTERGQFLALKMFSGFLTGMDYLREQARDLPTEYKHADLIA